MSATAGTWPVLPLRSVLRPVSRFETVQGDREYRQLGVRLWGRGAYEREPILGKSTRYSRLNRVAAEDVVVNKIWARNGSIAVVSDSLDGCFVSPEFPLFEIDRAYVTPSWFDVLTRWQGLWRRLDAFSQGTSGKNRITPERFLDVPVPIPSLPEQAGLSPRLLALETTLGTIASRMDENADALSTVPAVLADRLLGRLAERWPVLSFGDASALITSGPRNFGGHYADDGERFYRAQDIGADFRVKSENVVFVSGGEKTRRSTVAAGDLLVVITGATIGRCAMVSADDQPGLVSQHVGLIRLEPSKVLPEFGLLSLMSPSWAGGQLLGARYRQGKPGLNLGNLAALRVPVPTIEVQRETIEAVADVSAAVRLSLDESSRTRDRAHALWPQIVTRLLGAGDEIGAA